MKISVFGLGYVGTVAMGCLASLGHRMIGVDVSNTKVRLLNEGKSPIVEAEISQLISQQWTGGNIRATTDAKEAVCESDLSFICVGTPPQPQGHLSVDAILNVGRQIGVALASKNGFHVICIRSTVPPGTAALLGDVISKSSSKLLNADFAIVSNPEFLREGSAVNDFFNPPHTILASSSSRGLDIVRQVYKGIRAPVLITSVPVAEMIKYVNNAFHAVKVTFANEVGKICRHLGVDSLELMQTFCLDTKLNISPYYLKPGFAFGGSCLPRDLKALVTMAHDLYLEAPVLENVIKSNEAHKRYVLDQILSLDVQRIGFLGLAFKAGTDDLRSSPIIDILETLAGKGFRISIYDPSVLLSRLVGTNKDFIMKRLPLISQYITDNPQELLEHAQLLVIVNDNPQYSQLLQSLKPETIVYDLVHMSIKPLAAAEQLAAVV